MSSVVVNEAVLEVRRYQQPAVALILEGRNVLIVGPTGIGKTYLMIQSLIQFFEAGRRAVLIIAPTIHLTEQLARTIGRAVPSLDVYHEETRSPKARDLAHYRHEVFVTRPELIRNDLRRGTFPLDWFELLFIDEGPYALHNPRSPEGYAYCPVARQFAELNIQRVAFAPTCLEASIKRPTGLGFPVTSFHVPPRLGRQAEVMANLRLDSVYVIPPQELRGYLPPRAEISLTAEFSAPMALTVRWIEEVITRVIRELVQLKYLRGKIRRKAYPKLSLRYRTEEKLIPQVTLNAIRQEVNLRIAAEDPRGRVGRMFVSIYQIMRQAWYLAVHHSPAVVHEYLRAQVPLSPEDWQKYPAHKKHPKSTDWMRNYPSYQRYLEVYRSLLKLRADPAQATPPLWQEVIALCRDHLMAGQRVLIFCGFVEVAVQLTEVLQAALGSAEQPAPARYLVGQQHPEWGMSLAEQRLVMAAYRAGSNPILCSTSLTEPGIDLDDQPIDAVVHLDTPYLLLSEVNRSGRVGRKQPGYVYQVKVSHPLSELLVDLARYRPGPMVVASSQPSLEIGLVGRRRDSFFREEMKTGGVTDPWADELDALYEQAPASGKTQRGIPLIARFWSPGLSARVDAQGRFTGWFQCYDRRGGPINCFVGELNPERYRYYYDLPFGPIIIAGRLIRTSTGVLALTVDEERNRTEYLVPCPEGNWYFTDYK